jgi:hypothetical protein
MESTWKCIYFCVHLEIFYGLYPTSCLGLKLSSSQSPAVREILRVPLIPSPPLLDQTYAIEHMKTARAGAIPSYLGEMKYRYMCSNTLIMTGGKFFFSNSRASLQYLTRSNALIASNVVQWTVLLFLRWYYDVCFRIIAHIDVE